MSRRGENLSGVSPIQDGLSDASQIGVSLSRANLGAAFRRGQNGGPARKRKRKPGVFSGVRPSIGRVGTVALGGVLTSGLLLNALAF
jgi:hypothetical protein